MTLGVLPLGFINLLFFFYICQLFRNVVFHPLEKKGILHIFEIINLQSLFMINKQYNKKTNKKKHKKKLILIVLRIKNFIIHAFYVFMKQVIQMCK